MRAWLRANRWALLLLVVLIPGAILTSFLLRFLPYLQAQPQPEPLGVDETARYSGADITFRDLIVIPGEELDAPEGRDVAAALWEIEVTDPIEYALCETFLKVVIDGVEREYDPESFSSYDVGGPPDAAQSCNLTETGEYSLVQVYLVPAGEVEDFAVELSSAAESPRVLRSTEASNADAISEN